jgi:xanthine/uracil/vitamin C permease (AzgA family)
MGRDEKDGRWQRSRGTPTKRRPATSTDALMATLDRPAIARGVALAAIIAVPSGVAAVVVDGSGLLVLIALVGLTLGAMRAAQLQSVGMPLRHGIVTAVGVFVAIQAIGVARRAVDPDVGVGWARIASNIVLSVLCGTIGGVIGGRLGVRDRSGGEP